MQHKINIKIYIKNVQLQILGYIKTNMNNIGIHIMKADHIQICTIYVAYI